MVYTFITPTKQTISSRLNSLNTKKAYDVGNPGITMGQAKMSA